MQFVLMEIEVACGKYFAFFVLPTLMVLKWKYLNILFVVLAVQRYTNMDMNNLYMFFDTYIEFKTVKKWLT